MRFASAICSAMAIMLAGYIPSILANYHFHLRLMKQRTNQPLWEGVFILTTLVALPQRSFSAIEFESGKALRIPASARDVNYVTNLKVVTDRPTIS